MKSKSRNLRKLGACAFLLCLNVAPAYANHAERAMLQLDRFNARLDRQAQRHQERADKQLIRMQNQNVQIPLSGTLSVGAGPQAPFHTVRPDRTTYINELGRTRSVRNDVALDLSSTDAIISVGGKLLGDSTVRIAVGGTTKEIKAGSLVTPAEFAALNQVLETGSQDLKLNETGAAVSGSLNLNVVSDSGRAIQASSFVVPQGVTVGGDFGRHADGIRVTNDLVNYGSIYAGSSTHRGVTAMIGARDVDNYGSGLITTKVDGETAAKLGLNQTNLNLALSADRDLNNQGEISSAGSLKLSAGRAINNAGLVTASGDVSLHSATINNAALVSSERGNANIIAPVDANLAVNNAGGEFRALAGNINLATTVGTNEKTSTTVMDGQWHAQELNISSGNGRIVGSVDDVTAKVNVTGGTAEFSSKGDMTLGKVEVSGDPLFTSGANFTISADISTGGNPLAIIAAADINVSGATTISTASAGTSGGSITLVAGAQFNVNPGVSVTVNGGSFGGGLLNLAGITTLDSKSTSGTGNGGNIALIAYGGQSITGIVSVPNAFIISSANGTGTPGNVTVLAEDFSGTTGISLIGITANGGATGGNVVIANTNISGTPVVFDNTAGASQGAIISGSFAPSGTLNGSILVGNSIATNGGTVSISTGATASIFSVDTSASATNANAGQINISGNSAVNLTSTIKAVGNGSGSSADIIIQSAGSIVSSGLINASSILSNGGDVSINSTGGSINFSDINTSAGVGAVAGNIQITGNNLVTCNASQVNASASSGTGGQITISANSTLSFTTNTLIQAGGSTNGNISLGSLASNILLNGNDVSISNNAVGSGGLTSISTDANHGLDTQQGDFSILSWGNVSLNLGSLGIVTGGNTGAGDIVIESAAGSINGSGVNINTVPLAGNSGGGDVMIVSGTTQSLAIGTIDASSLGTSLIPGAVQLTSGSGGLTVGTITSVSAASPSAGSVSITAFQIPALTLPTISSGNLSVTNTGSITTGSDIQVSSGNILSSLGTITIGDDVGDGLTAASDLTLGAVSYIQTGTLTAPSLTVNMNGVGVSTLDATTDLLQGNVINGTLQITTHGASDLGINTSMLNLKVTSNNTNGINVIGATNFDSLDLTVQTGQNIIIAGAIVGNTNGSVTLTVDDGNINEGASGSIQTSGTGATNIVVNGVSTVDLTKPNNINRLSATGAGTIVSVNNGSNPIALDGINGSFDLAITTTDAASGITVASALNAGVLQFNTPRFFTDTSVSGSSILIQNPSGALTIAGGASPGGSLNATTPPPGSPGFPSSPTAINILTTGNANLTLSGNLGFSGDATLNCGTGTTTSLTNSLFHSNDNIVLKAATWVQQGPTPPQITANDFIFIAPGFGTLINTSGAINFGTNVSLIGHDFAIIAATDINITAATTIDLSSAFGKAGTLTMLAGYTFTPNSGGQVLTDAPTYLFSSATAGGGNVNATNLTINTSSNGGNAGDVVIVANNGTVTVGNINASATGASGLGGRVTIIGQLGVTAGNINNAGTDGDFGVRVSSAVPLVFGSPQVDNGTISNGSFGTNSSTVYTANNIIVGNLNSVDVRLRSAGQAANSITFGTLTGTSILNVNANLGTIVLPTDTITMVSTPTIGGDVQLTAGNVTHPTSGVPLTIDVSSAARGGSVTFTRTSSTALTVDPSTLIFNATGGTNAGEVSIIATGGLTINAGSINDAGANGIGAQRTFRTTGGVLTINDQSLLTLNGTGLSGGGGTLIIDSPTIAGISDPLNPFTVTANGSGTGAGGGIFITTSSTDPFFIGTPVKQPKGPAGYLTLNALGGVSGGRGGQIFVDVGGSLTVNVSDINANPLAGTSTGATYGLTAGTNLVISGSLDASGISGGGGGLIVLTSNTKTAFSIDAGKTPKNGISGSLTANGSGGRIEVYNLGGGVTANASMSADRLLFESHGKGAISVASGATLTGSNRITLTSDTGAIGKKAITIDTPLIIANGLGAVNLLDTNIGATQILNSSAGKGGFNVTTSGATDLFNINTNGGGINIVGGNGGTLSVSSNISATDGGIILSNPDTTSGDILISADVTTGGNKGGQVVIAIGAPPKKGTSPQTLVSGFDLNPQGKGQIFFDPDVNGVIHTGSTDATVNATNKSVIFSNLSTNAANKITIVDAVLIEADPPSAKQTATPNTVLPVWTF